MKKYLSILFLAGTCSTLYAQDYNIEPYQVKQLAAASIQQVKVETTGGNIFVAGTTSAARIEVYLAANNSNGRLVSKEELTKRLDDYNLTITAENHVLTVIAKPKHSFANRNTSLSISFKIFVPTATATTLRTSGGNISLTGLTGTQDFSTSGGNIDVDHLAGHIKGKTSGGNISLSDLKDDIDLSTSGGNIQASGSNGNITLATSGGDVNINRLRGNVKATTSGGNVQGDKIDGELYARTSGGNVDLRNLSCSVETSTSGGDIDVSITTLGKYVKISNSGGHVSLQVPAGKGINLDLSAERVTASGMTGFKGEVKKDRINGALNGGGIPVTVHGGSELSFTQQ